MAVELATGADAADVPELLTLMLIVVVLRIELLLFRAVAFSRCVPSGNFVLSNVPIQGDPSVSIASQVPPSMKKDIFVVPDGPVASMATVPLTCAAFAGFVQTTVEDAVVAEVAGADESGVTDCPVPPAGGALPTVIVILPRLKTLLLASRAVAFRTCAPSDRDVTSTVVVQGLPLVSTSIHLSSTKKPTLAVVPGAETSSVMFPLTVAPSTGVSHSTLSLPAAPMTRGTETMMERTTNVIANCEYSRRFPPIRCITNPKPPKRTE